MPQSVQYAPHAIADRRTPQRLGKIEAQLAAVEIQKVRNVLIEPEAAATIFGMIFENAQNSLFASVDESPTRPRTVEPIIS
jgi:hypothetical protein